MTNTTKCTFCPEPATGNTQLPACGAHEDLLILTEWMTGKGQEPTIEAVAGHIERARALSGGWTILPEQVPTLLPEFLEKKKEIINGH